MRLRRSPDGGAYPTYPGHPHLPFIPPCGEAKPEFLDRPGIRLDGNSSRHLDVSAIRRSIGTRVLIGFLGVRIGRGPRRHALALLPRQHLEPADWRQCRLRPRQHQEAHRSEEHTSELQSLTNLVCRLLLEKKKI